jgi:V/A-type H+/Na+-transporting ATPase subunit D
MTGPAIRSRLHTLAADLRAARLGRDLLDDKREAILRTLSDRSRQHAAAATRVEELWASAQRALLDACLEMGSDAVDAAALAQPVHATISWRAGSVVGVATPRLQESIGAFAAYYGAATTTASLDRAGLEFTLLVQALVRLAEAEEAVRNLRAALQKTVRRLEALEQLVIPELDREGRAVASALEEEERDDSIRARRARLQVQAGARRQANTDRSP